jgi:hypothetical protein
LLKKKIQWEIWGGRLAKYPHRFGNAQRLHTIPPAGFVREKWPKIFSGGSPCTLSCRTVCRCLAGVPPPLCPERQ